MAVMAKAPAQKGPPPLAFTPPEARLDLVGHADVEAKAAGLIARRELTNGWLIAGPSGIGKATMAFRIARALLDRGAAAPAETSGLDLGDAPAAPTSLQRHGDSRAASLIAAGSHPDLFIARRQWNDKTQKFAQEITVDTIRALTRALAQTPAMGDWRVAIVDTADDMNRNAANALLKALEEPPARTSVLLLSARPGRLLATIRSRCRRLDLRPVATEDIASFLVREDAAGATDASVLAEAGKGRPGFALALAAADGAAALAAVDAFVKGAGRNGAPEPVIAKLTARGAEDVWRLFKDLLVDKLTGMALDAGRRNQDGITDMIAARDDSLELLARGDALNLDRGALLVEVARRARPLARLASDR